MVLYDSTILFSFFKMPLQLPFYSLPGILFEVFLISIATFYKSALAALVNRIFASFVEWLHTICAVMSGFANIAVIRMR